MEVDDLDLEFKTTSAVAGVNINDYFSIEARYTETLNDQEVSGLDVSIDDNYGLYGLFSLPVTKNVDVYAVAGRTHAKATAKSTHCNEYHCETYSESESDTFSSYGFGLTYALNSNMTVRGEFMRVDDDIEANTVSFLYHF